MALVNVKVPDIGDFKDVAVIELMVKVGDTITVDQSLVTVESDKASMEIPSSHAGVVKEIKVAIGDTVNEGSLLVVVEAAGEAATAPAPTPAAPAAAAPVAAAAAPATPAAAAATGLIEVRVPDIGDFAEVAVIEVMVKPGDAIKVEQSLITVESDKASMEIPSSHAGVVKEVKVALGDKVAMGSLVVVIEGVVAGTAAPAAAAAPAPAAAAAAPVAAAPAPAAAAPAPAAVPAHEPTAAKAGLPHASPTIRRLARELGVPLAEVAGSGPKGRILQADVQGFVKRVMAGDVQTGAQKAKAPPPAAAGSGEAFPGLLPWPKVDFAKFGPIERKDLLCI